MADEVILLDFWASPFGARVRLALEEKGVTYEYREESTFNKSPLLLKMNPIHRKIPVLIHNGKAICETSIIVQYVDDVWNTESPLMPQHPYQRANARFWTDFIDKKIYDGGRELWRSKGEALKGFTQEFIGYLKLLEGELGDKPYFNGESYGFLDLSFIAFTNWWYAYEKCANFSVEKECPKLMAWVKRCMEKESVAKVLPDSQRVYEFVVDLRKRFGIE